MMAAGFVLALSAAAATTPEAAPPPLPEARYVVLSPNERNGGPGTLSERTHDLLAAMHELGLLRYRRSRLVPAALSGCLGVDIDPSPERTACLRSMIGPSEDGVPVVAMVIGYTRERGAWQRLECIGPDGRGFVRSVYVDQAFHIQPSWRGTIRDKVLGCVRDSLTPT